MLPKQHIAKQLLTFYGPVFVLLAISLELVLSIWYPEGLGQNDLQLHRLLFWGTHVTWLVTFSVLRLSHPERFRNAWQLAQTAIIAMAANSLVAVLVFYVQPNLIITPRRFLLTHAIIAFVLVFAWATALYRIRKHAGSTRLVFFGNEKTYTQLEKDLAAPDMFDHSMTHAQTPQDILEHAQAHPTKTIILFTENLPTEKAFISDLRTVCVRGAICQPISQFYEDTLQRVRLEDVSNEWLLQFGHRPVDTLYLWLKRAIDFTAGVLLTGVLLILLLPIALLNTFFNKGPLFFTQQRVSLDGNAFVIYKLRTMKTGTRSDTWTKHNDDRITAFGHFLRKTRIDELPQALNLLKGDMSLVGPRPEQVNISRSLAEEIPFYQARHMVRPGLTGWAQLHVYARTEEDSAKKLQYDLYYLKHRSFLFDLEIMARTCIHVMRIQGV